MAFEIDEFQSPPDGTFSTADKTRMMSFGFTVAPTVAIDYDFVLGVPIFEWSVGKPTLGGMV